MRAHFAPMNSHTLTCLVFGLSGKLDSVALLLLIFCILSLNLVQSCCVVAVGHSLLRLDPIANFDMYARLKRWV